MPQITVFVPYYNDEKYLKECINSILSQTFQDFELILLNHASTDYSTQIANSYSDPRIKHIIMPENIGGGGGLLLKEALKIAKGKYFKPFCADDVMLPNCLEALFNYLESNPKKDFCFADLSYIDENSNLRHKYWWDNKPFQIQNVSREDLIRYYLEYKSFLPWPSAMFKTQIVEIEKLNIVTVMFFDMSVWLDLLIKGHDCGLIKESLVLYRTHDEQMVRDGKRKNMNEFEVVHFNKCFLEIKDVELMQKIMPKNQFAHNLQNGDNALIPFVLCMYWLNTELYQPANKRFALDNLHDILHSPQLASQIKQKFNFGIKELRDIYKNTNFTPAQKKKTFYHKITRLLKDIAFFSFENGKFFLKMPYVFKSLINRLKRLQNKKSNIKNN